MSLDFLGDDYISPNFTLLPLRCDAATCSIDGVKDEERKSEFQAQLRTVDLVTISKVSSKPQATD